MATYVNDLRLTELATGEGSGTWGTTTNTNLELIGEALGYGTQNCFASDADATTTVADGASDPARSMYFKVTSSATLTATRVLTIAPNTVSRVMFIENATTGSQSITISQGSGANVTIATGKTAVVYLDGAGSTAAVVDAMALVDPGVTDTLAEVLVAGNTSGGTGLTMSSGDDLTLTGASYNAVWDSSDSALEFADNAKAVFGAGSDLQIYHDGSNSYITDSGTGNLRISGTLIQLNDASFNKYLLGSGDSVTLYHADSAKLATTSTGINVTGSVTADGLTVDGTATISAASPTLTFTDTDTGADTILNAASSVGSFQINVDANNEGSAPVFTTAISGSEYFRITESSAVFNENSADVDFRVESNTNTHALFVDAGNSRVGINTTSVGAALQIGSIASGSMSTSSRSLLIVGDSGADDGIRLTRDEGSQNQLDQYTHINNDGTATFTSRGGTSTTGSFNFKITDGTTTTTPLHIDSSGNLGISDDTPENKLTVVDTDSGSGIAVVKARTPTTDGRASYQIGNDAANWFMGIDGGNSDVFFISDAVGSGDKFVIGSTGNITQTNTSAGAGAGPLLNLHRDSASPADNDYIGEIRFRGENDASEIINYAGFATRIIDVTDGTEDGRFELYTSLNGSQISRVLSDASETVINQDSADLDFRVESDNSSAMLFVDASTDRVGVGVAAPTNTFDVQSSDTNAVRIRGSSNLPLYSYHDSSGVGIASGAGTSYSDLIYLYPAAKAIRFYTDGVFRNAFIDTENVFNETGVNTDFRVESDNNANMLFVDGGNNHVIVGGSVNYENATLQVQGAKNLVVGIPQEGIAVTDTTAVAAGVGGGITFNGVYNSSGDVTNFASVEGEKRIATSGHYDGALVLKARTNGTNTHERARFDDVEAVINGEGRNTDFRVESDSQTHAFFIDAGANRIGINQGAPNAALDIITAVTAGADALRLKQPSSSEIYQLQLGVSGQTNNGLYLRNTESTGQLQSWTAGEVVINDNSVDRDFRVESDSNTHALFVDAGNNRVGVLNNNPAYAFHVDAEVASSGYFRVDSSSTYAGTALLTLKRNGNTTGDYLQMRDGSNNVFATFDEGGIILNEIGGDTDFRVESNNNASMFVVDASADNVQIVKAQSGSSALDVSNNSSNGSNVGAIATSLDSTSNNTNCWHLKSTTQLINSYYLYGDGSSSFTSDGRLKTDIVNLEDGYLEKFNTVRLVNFKWKAAPDSPAQMGVIAQEIEEIFPDLVSEDEDAIGTGETYKAVSYSKLNTIALKVIQELSAKVEILEARIAALESN